MNNLTVGLLVAVFFLVWWPMRRLGRRWAISRYPEGGRMQDYPLASWLVWPEEALPVTTVVLLLGVFLREGLGWAPGWVVWVLLAAYMPLAVLARFGQSARWQRAAVLRNELR
jgi:hypothetical protein